jgi:hypothetical protein
MFKRVVDATSLDVQMSRRWWSMRGRWTPKSQDGEVAVDATSLDVQKCRREVVDAMSLDVGRSNEQVVVNATLLHV